jgi:hypothetical protein
LAARPTAPPNEGEADMKLLLLALPLIALAACDTGPKVEADNAKPSEVAEKMRDAVGGETFVRPGKWLSTVTIQDMDMPGMPPEFSAKMREAMVARQVETCLTPDQAKRPKGDFFAADKSCQYDHFEMRGGKLDAAMRCEHDGMSQATTMTGDYSPDAYQMTMSTKMEGTGPQSGMTMKMQVAAKRIGDCDKPAASGAAN